MLLKKDNSLHICYSYTAENHTAYKYNKINNLITNRLFHTEKYKDSLIILGTIADTRNKYLKFLDPVNI